MIRQQNGRKAGRFMATSMAVFAIMMTNVTPANAAANLTGPYGGEAHTVTYTGGKPGSGSGEEACAPYTKTAVVATFTAGTFGSHQAYPVSPIAAVINVNTTSPYGNGRYEGPSGSYRDNSTDRTATGCVIAQAGAVAVNADPTSTVSVRKAGLEICSATASVQDIKRTSDPKALLLLSGNTANNVRTIRFTCAGTVYTFSGSYALPGSTGYDTACVAPIMPNYCTFTSVRIDAS